MAGSCGMSDIEGSTPRAGSCPGRSTSTRQAQVRHSREKLSARVAVVAHDPLDLGQQRRPGGRVGGAPSRTARPWAPGRGRRSPPPPAPSCARPGPAGTRRTCRGGRRPARGPAAPVSSGRAAAAPGPPGGCDRSQRPRQQQPASGEARPRGRRSQAWTARCPPMTAAAEPLEASTPGPAGGSSKWLGSSGAEREQGEQPGVAVALVAPVQLVAELVDSLLEPPAHGPGRRPP